jgi:ankyrin repeat protein
MVMASRNGHSNVVNRLLERLLNKGADVNQQNYKGDTALMMAVEMGYNNIVNRLLDVKDIDVNVQNPERQMTPLMWATHNGFLKLVERLLNKGADVNQQNYKGDTALMMAVNTHKTREAPDGLYSSGIQKERERRTKKWISSGAQRRLGVVALLLEDKDIDVNQQNHKGDTALMMAVQEDSFFDLYFTRDEEEEKEPVWLPAMKAWVKVVALLLEDKDIDVNRRNHKGDTALMMAVQVGNGNIVALFLKDKDIDVNPPHIGENSLWDSNPILYFLYTNTRGHIKLVGDTYQFQTCVRPDYDGAALCCGLSAAEQRINDGRERELEWILTQFYEFEDNKKCKSECKKTPGRGAQYSDLSGRPYCTCNTDPYSYFFQTYDWDYCKCLSYRFKKFFL